MKNESKRCIHNLQFLAYWYVKFAQCTIQSELDSYLYTSTLLPKPVNYMDIIHMPTNQPHKSKKCRNKNSFPSTDIHCIAISFYLKTSLQVHSSHCVCLFFYFLSLQHLY